MFTSKFWLGFFSGIATLLLLGLGMNLFWGPLLESPGDRRVALDYQLQLTEMVRRIENALSNTNGDVQVSPKDVSSRPRIWVDLPAVSDLEDRFVFFGEYVGPALKRGESVIPVVAEKLGHYKRKRGAWVGFIQPGQVRWLNEKRYADLLSRIQIQNLDGKSN